MAVQSRTLPDKLKTIETCELAKSGKCGVVKPKDLFNYIIIIPLYQAFVKLVMLCSKPLQHA